MDSIGERLKKIRQLRGITQLAVSEKAKINAALYRQYECGDRTPKIEQLQKIASALDVDIAFLQPSRTDTPFAILALLFDFIGQYGDIVMQNKGGTVLFGIDHFHNSTVNEKLLAALNAHEKLSIEDFKKWLIDYPPLVHDGKVVERD